MGIIPRFSSKEVRANHRDERAWRNFAQRISFHPGVKKYLAARESWLCGYCQQPLHDDYQVHHIDYDHSCTYGVTKELSAPTPKRPTKTRTIPDCKGCHASDVNGFSECMRRLTVVHRGCNAKIFQVQQADR